MFSKILVPLDGSEHSWKALEGAAQIAKKFSGKLTLIHVYSAQPIMVPQPSAASSLSLPIVTGAEVSTMIKAAKKLGNRILKDGEKRIKTLGVQVEKMLVEGTAVEEIVRAANQGNFDLIVIGARGISRMREMLLGSVTEGVMHHVRCPVLVVK